MSLNLSQMKVIRFILLSEIFLCQKFPDSKCQFSSQALALKNTSIKLEKMHRTDVYHKLFFYPFFLFVCHNSLISKELNWCENYFQERL